MAGLQACHLRGTHWSSQRLAVDVLQLMKWPASRQERCRRQMPLKRLFFTRTTSAVFTLVELFTQV